MSIDTKVKRMLAFIGGCFVLLSSPLLQAQVYTTVKDARFALTALTQTSTGTVAAIRITNKDILAALNASGAFNFSPGASLLLRSVNGGQPFFVVRDINGGHVSTTDISAYLILASHDDAVHSPESAINWALWEYSLNVGGAVDFDTWGLTTLCTGLIPTGDGGELQRTVRLTSTVSGPGHVDGAPSQCSGFLHADHGRLE